MDPPSPAPATPGGLKAAAPATPAADIAVEIEHVSKSFGDNEAVRDLSLELRRGEVFAFLGPNGAGKTTTLKMTTGLLRPDRGTVRVCGLCMRREARAAKQHIAYIPDQVFIYDKLTGREFINFTREMYGISEAVANGRLAALSRRLGMASFVDQLCETFSHGMRQKVALAAALIHEPQVLVVDEPMVGLDPRTARVIKDILCELADAGCTVFMSTHTLDVAEQVADRIGIIHHGRLVALGTLAELRRQAALDGRLEDVFLRLTEEPTDETPPGAR